MVTTLEICRQKIKGSNLTYDEIEKIPKMFHKELVNVKNIFLFDAELFPTPMKLGEYLKRNPETQTNWFLEMYESEYMINNEFANIANTAYNHIINLNQS